VNKVGWKYCPKRKGDAQYLNYLTKLKGVVQAGLNCHTTSKDWSQPFSWWPCADLQNQFPGFEHIAIRAELMLEPNGNANTQDVDWCIKEEIINQYWMGDSQVDPGIEYFARLLHRNHK
jgi:hypothetical protein